MVDIVDKKTRSRMMSRIRARDTSPELAVRKALFAAGFRYRLHSRRLPGCPDIVLPRHKIIVLVNGCFWHRHARCRLAYVPKSNVAFWMQKFDENVSRDRRVKRALKKAGWTIHIVWECQVHEEGLQKLLRQMPQQPKNKQGAP